MHHIEDNCGGCPWIAATIECQRAEKQHAVEREISRISKDALVHSIRTDVPEWGYRRRSRLGYRDQTAGFRRRNERRVFNLERCLVLDPRLNAALPDLRAEIASRTGRHKSGNVDFAIDYNGNVAIDGPARVFLQPSATTESVLIELVSNAVPKTNTHIGELFAGAGTFTAPLIDKGHCVTAWEIDKRSVKSLRLRCPNAKVHQLDLFKKIERLDLSGVDIVLLDPPRAGAKECMPAILKSRATKVIYVSCDLATLCRDLRILQDGGFTITDVMPVDAFPQTPHIECVTVLNR
jgi:23S rRNA (uracil1939-C5)-methyltransferase